MAALSLKKPYLDVPAVIARRSSSQRNATSSPNKENSDKCFISRISDEVMIHLLSYLRALDLGLLTRVDKDVFAKERIEQAVRLIINSSPSLQLFSPLKKQQNIACTVYTPPSLYVLEVTNILAAISFPLPLTGEKGKLRVSYIIIV